MFLNSLTLHGFKSFIDKTTLDVEPGITVIVGPNGSGKSNIVDAMAWVLGTHAPSRIRGGSMADVIFAGGPDRAPGRRARVEISIDNSDGRLGREGLGTAGSGKRFAEVRVAREVHRDGESRYLINGEEVRALDVQELLSDTGLGRELHTIVGQGQLDAILNARPEDRRAFIEEAAGILKHRRRRERALRKMEAVDDHMERLRSVLRELRRQLRPLERQAEAADKADRLEQELRVVRARVAAVDLAQLQARLDDDRSAEQMVAEREQAVTDDLRRRERFVSALLDQLSEREPASATAERTHNELVNLRERLRGSSRLIDARLRHLVEYVEQPLTARPPDELRSQADALQLQLAGLGDELATCRATLDQAVEDRRTAEDRRRELDRRIEAEQRRRAILRERVLRWEGEVSAVRGAIATSEAEVGRISSQLAGLDERIEEATAAIAKVTDEIQRLDVDEVTLTRALERAETRVASATEQVDELDAELRTAETARASLRARAEALRAALEEETSGAAALVDAGPSGLLGRMADHVRIDGPEPAVAAALGPLGSGLAAASVEDAGSAIAWLRSSEGGGAHVLPVREGELTVPDPMIRNAGGRPIGDLLLATSDNSEPVAAALRAAVASCWLAADWDAALRLHRQFPQHTFITPNGDAAGPRGFVGGGAPERSAVATATAADEAEGKAEDLDRSVSELGKRLVSARRDLATSQEELAEASRNINESDARITGAAEQLARLNQEQVALTNQRAIVVGQLEELRSVLDRDREQLAQLNSRGPEEPEEDDGGVDPEAARRADDQLERTRSAELEARVALERQSEQSRHLSNQVEALRSEASQVEASLAAAEDRRRRRRESIVTCERLGTIARRSLDAIEASIARAETARGSAGDALATTRTSLEEARGKADEARAAVDAVREDRHAADLQRAELAHEHQTLVDRVSSVLGMTADELRKAHPEESWPRERLVEKEDTLVRKIGMIGRINPLALEEFRALEERHAFLKDQLADLRSSKRNLETVVVQVDAKIEEVFAEAWHDVAEAFEEIFETLFPGGKGRLVLTDPEDMLTTGVEVEARPPGKKVTRLSLLSGGERSLTVLAFVFAIFRARPSPFYVLDEVDAALDDINLQRLLTVIESFRGKAQIIMVTHQKRSMEAADVLYGVTMGKSAITTVVAERLVDVEIPDTPESLTTS